MENEKNNNTNNFNEKRDNTLMKIILISVSFLIFIGAFVRNKNYSITINLFSIFSSLLYVLGDRIKTEKNKIKLGILSFIIYIILTVLFCYGIFEISSSKVNLVLDIITGFLIFINTIVFFIKSDSQS